MSSVSSDVFFDDEKLQQGADENFVEMEVFDILDQARRDNPSLTRLIFSLSHFSYNLNTIK